MLSECTAPAFEPETGVTVSQVEAPDLETAEKNLIQAAHDFFKSVQWELSLEDIDSLETDVERLGGHLAALKSARRAEEGVAS